MDPEDGGGDGVFAEINITPLTDIFLVLLIIFMVTSTVIVRQKQKEGGSQAGIEVNLPRGGATDVIRSRKDLPVAVLTDGRVVLSGTVVTLDELSRVFEETSGTDQETLVIIQADEGVPHGRVVEVMERARKAGLGHLAIGVRAEE